MPPSSQILHRVVDALPPSLRRRLRAVRGRVRPAPLSAPPPAGGAALKAARSELRAARRELRTVKRDAATLRRAVGEWPPGHFYSPVPDLDAVRAREAEIWAVPAGVPGIDARAEAQLALLPAFAEFYAEQPWSDDPVGELRYGFANGYFSYGDGLVLYAMLRHLKPRRIVEVGSGWSSALMLDVADRFLGDDLRLTFIEPYPERLHGLLRPADHRRAEILEMPLHDVDAAVFTALEPGDVLFVDSTHVSKIGSDVNQLVHEVLPILPPGVHVHVHDIFWPFEYPQDWVYRGRAWSEAYLLRAYLTHNPRARITWFNHFLAMFHSEEVAAGMPLWRKNSGGSLWFESL